MATEKSINLDNGELGKDIQLWYSMALCCRCWGTKAELRASLNSDELLSNRFKVSISYTNNGFSLHITTGWMSMKDGSWWMNENGLIQDEVGRAACRQKALLRRPI